MFILLVNTQKREQDHKCNVHIYKLTARRLCQLAIGGRPRIVTYTYTNYIVNYVGI